MASTRAIVLSKENFGEADQYIQFLTRDWGVITLLARSSRKSKRRYVGGLDLFCHDEISLRGGIPTHSQKKPYLNELLVLNSFPKMRESLDKLLEAGRAAQWVRKLLPNPSPMPTVYTLFGQTLALIEKEENTEKLEMLSLIFRLKLLSAIGLRPQTNFCARCENEFNLVIFDRPSGGMICENCARAHRLIEADLIEQDEHQLLRAAEHLKLSAAVALQFPQEKVKHLLRVTTGFASYHTHQKLPL